MEKLNDADGEWLACDYACDRRGQAELLLEILCSERNESIDNDDIKDAVEHREHVRTVGQ